MAEVVRRMGGRKMSRLLQFFAVIAVVFDFNPAVAENWAVYRPQGIGFSIEMPERWTVTTRDDQTAAGSVKAYVASAETASAIFTAEYAAHPEVRGKAVSLLLDGARNGAVENVNGKLRSEDQILISNLPGRQIIIDAPQEIVIVARFFLLDYTLIGALVTGFRGVELEPNTKRFLDSMQVVPK